jgi:protein TonB
MAGVIFALVFHGSAAARTALIPIALIRWTAMMTARIHDNLWASYDVDILKEQPPEPPPPPAEEPPEEKPEPKAAPPPPAPKEKEQPPPPEPPPPAPAQASAIMTSPDDTIDFTGNGFVTGSAETFAGGVTHQAGTSATAVRSLKAQPGGVPGATGTGSAPPPPSVDRSRPVSLKGSTEWKCPWPAEAETEQIDEAKVRVRISVGADGKASRVEVLSDPGHGFGREARQCAMRETYNPALDVNGTPIPGTKEINVTFER